MLKKVLISDAISVFVPRCILILVPLLFSISTVIGVSENGWLCLSSTKQGDFSLTLFLETGGPYIYSFML